MMRRQAGFTLMELLIVIAVLLIISVVGLDSFVFSLKKSRDAARKTDLATIAKSLESYANDWGSYPEDDGAGKMVACDYTGTGVVACDWGDQLSTMMNGVLVTYLAKIPMDPTSSQNYYYEKTTAGYNLYAAIENTSDPYYQSSGITATCGTGVTCNYQMSQSGVQ